MAWLLLMSSTMKTLSHNRKLVLKRENLRNLQSIELAKVAGGGTVASCNSCYMNCTLLANCSSVSASCI